MSARRLVAVLGYSDRSTEELHPVCAARIARAEREAREDDAVLLSGSARGRRPVSEARLMASAWTGGANRLLVDHGSRSTFGNAVRTAAAARALDVDEVVLVTSGWHSRRAATLVRAALRGSGRRVTVAATSEPAGRAAALRELACWALVPLQLPLAGRSR